MDYTKEQCEKKIAKWTERLENCKIELEVGKWYKRKEYLICITYIGGGCLPNQIWLEYYGFSNNSFKNGSWQNTDWANELTPATSKEVRDAIFAESKKKGFKEGVKIKPLDNFFYISNCNFVLSQTNEYSWDGISLAYSIPNNGMVGVFKEGKWAEIIPSTPEYTMEELTDKLGHTFKIKK